MKNKIWFFVIENGRERERERKKRWAMVWSEKAPGGGVCESGINGRYSFTCCHA